MEKYSAYRDPGTGIQPFLTPVPPLGSNTLATVLTPLTFTLGLVRTTAILALTLVYILFVRVLCLVFIPIPPLHRLITWIFTAILSRTILLLLGFINVPVSQVSRKRGRSGQVSESWSPKAGDVIVSNWVSWLELLWFAFRFDPTFVLPVAEGRPKETTEAASPLSNTGRRTGTGSANVSSGKNRPLSARVPIIGFKKVTLLQMVRWSGRVLPTIDLPNTPVLSLEELSKRSRRPIVVFPECTTSNGRGLLNFASVFKADVPIKKYNIFIAAIRYDPPTAHSPSGSHSIPGTINPVAHLFSLACAISPPGISIRLLPPSEGPSNPLFLASDVVAHYDGDDQLAETCATLIAQTGKLKRIGLGWEDKSSFLSFYHSKG
ncbi:hypothetical protein DL96DRAFT_1594143 [Flagelloscypha sp. PMI_526]|nr:hypothetical protein DL96DRAFT_1594143 [Flagelloscypha sp. PMI_526]